MKHNAFTGDNLDFYTQIRKSIQNAENIDIIVSFLMKSGVEVILDELKKSDVKIRILTDNVMKKTNNIQFRIYTLIQCGLFKFLN